MGNPEIHCLILDASGTVRRCNSTAAAFFFTGPDILEGLHIKVLIPDLPLKSATPAFNVAYAAYCAGRSVWSWYKAVGAGGCTTGFYLSFVPPQADRQHEIVLHLRHSIEQIGTTDNSLSFAASDRTPRSERGGQYQ